MLIKRVTALVTIIMVIMLQAGTVICYSSAESWKQEKEIQKLTQPECNEKSDGKTDAQIVTEQKELFKAAEENDTIKLQYLINNGINVNAQDKHGVTALMIAAQSGNLEATQALIKAGADVTTKTKKGTTALHWACLQWRGHIQSGSENISIVQELIKAGADVNAKDDFGWTPLYSLSLARCVWRDVISNAIIELINAGADVNAKTNGVTALQAFSANGDAEAVRLLIQKGAEVNTRDDKGQTALHHATMNKTISQYYGGVRSSKEVIELLKAHAQIQLKDNEGKSPLMYAIKYNDRDAERLLREAGATLSKEEEAIAFAEKEKALLDEIEKHPWVSKPRDPEEMLYKAAAMGNLKEVQNLLKQGANANGEDQWVFEGKPLIIAIHCKHPEVVRELLKAGAELNETDWDGETALHIAAENGNIATVRLLIKAGVNVNASGICTPIGWAALRGHTKVVHALMQAGANININCEAYGNALRAAVISGHTDVVRLLLQAGAQANSIDANGETLIINAVKRGYTNIVKELINAGVDVNAKDKNGMSPLALAIEKGYKDIEKLLREASATLD